MVGDGRDQPREVLGSSRTPPPARVDDRAAGGRDLRRRCGAGGPARQAARRRTGDAVLHGELATHLLAAVVLRPVQRAVAVAPRVVTRDRGAVLHLLAVDRDRLLEAGAWDAPVSRRVLRHRHDCVGSAHGGAVSRHRSLACVLRHRHAGAAPARRRAARAAARAMAAAQQGRDQHRARGWAGVRDRLSRGVRQRRRQGRIHVSRRRPPVRCCGHVRHRVGRAAGAVACACASRARPAVLGRPDLLRPLSVALAGAGLPDASAHGIGRPGAQRRTSGHHVGDRRRVVLRGRAADPARRGAARPGRPRRRARGGDGDGDGDSRRDRRCRRAVGRVRRAQIRGHAEAPAPAAVNRPARDRRAAGVGGCRAAAPAHDRARRRFRRRQPRPRHAAGRGREGRAS